jgi:hypothetical protein
MKVFVVIFSKPLRIKVYSSLAAVFEAYTPEELGVSRATLDRWNFDANYVNSKVVISKSYTQTAGEVRRKKSK